MSTCTVDIWQETYWHCHAKSRLAMAAVTDAILKSVCAMNLGLSGCVDENVFLVRFLCFYAITSTSRPRVLNYVYT